MSRLPKWLNNKKNITIIIVKMENVMLMIIFTSRRIFQVLYNNKNVVGV